jgi:hypothetical protein
MLPYAPVRASLRLTAPAESGPPLQSTSIAWRRLMGLQFAWAASAARIAARLDALLHRERPLPPTRHERHLRLGGTPTLRR